MHAPGAVTQLDSRARVVTPENIAFEHRLAGPFARVTAYLLDQAVLWGAVMGVGLAGLLLFGLAGLPAVSGFVALMAWFLLYWFYGGLFEAVWNGQTPGKRMAGLRVLRTDGRPINATQAILRNLLRLIDAMPQAVIPGFFAEEAPLWYPTYLVGLVAATLTERRQRVGDLACGTMVVLVERTGVGRVEAPDEAGLDEALERVPAHFQPTPSLARALSHYVNRRRYFGPARRQEIARHVARPLVERWGLPAETNDDLLLCAIYVRAFLRGAGEGPAAGPSPPPGAAPPPAEELVELGSGA